MQAILNGLTGVGYLIDGTSAMVMRLDDESTSSTVPLYELPHILSGARHVDFVDVESAEQARRLLERGYAREESLDLALILLDSDSSDLTRTEAAAGLNRLLLEWGVRTWLEGVLYGAPLPETADLEGARRHAA